MLKACASRINQPLSYIYNHLLYKYFSWPS